MTTGPRFCVVRNDAPEGGWIILNGRDNGLGWTGYEWIDRQESARLIRFQEAAWAAEYAEMAFGVVQ